MDLQYKNIRVRTTLQPGDIGYITYLHGILYNRDFQYGISFEAYVAKGLYEFYDQYDEEKDRVWVCEHEGRIVGCLVLMHREAGLAQLRYFLVLPEYRGSGLGDQLMQWYTDWLREKNYKGSYLWTTHELEAAAALYKRYGFQLTEEHESTAFGKAVKEQRYNLQLA
jgi:N-acetylglutamate synthase-like GNAT family acetyltransferase